MKEKQTITEYVYVVIHKQYGVTDCFSSQRKRAISEFLKTTNMSEFEMRQGGYKVVKAVLEYKI